MNDKLQEALYIRDLLIQREQLIIAYSSENMDNLWTDCADNLPDVLPTNYDPSYLQLLIGLDSLLKNEDTPEEDILKVKDYIKDIVDDKLERTISFLKKRVEIINKNIKYLKKKFKKDWGMSYDEAIVNENIGKSDSNFNIDEILDKINARGMSSLTKDEKNFLKSSGEGDENNDDKKE